MSARGVRPAGESASEGPNPKWSRAKFPDRFESSAATGPPRPCAPAAQSVAQGPRGGVAGAMAQPLDGVVAYVDVTNWDGASAGGWVVKRLQSLGATVVDRLTKNLTHCVFKGTDADLRSLHDRVAKLGPFPPLVVKPDWATACGNEGRRALERPYMLTRPPDTVQSLMKSPSLGTGKKRRRSMQPLPLASYGARASREYTCGAVLAASATKKLNL